MKEGGVGQSIILDGIRQDVKAPPVLREMHLHLEMLGG